jgi:hypothetical protein
MPVLFRSLFVCLFIAAAAHLLSQTNIGYNPTYTGTGNGCTSGGTCYYVDYANGSDSNPGTSTSSPWKAAPGMACATGNAASHTLSHTDEIILKGGVTWPSACFQWNLTAGGTTTPNSTGYPGLYVGYDPSWNSGTVVSVRVTDPGNCTSGTTLSVSLTGGGGSGAAATAQVEVDPSAAGDLQFVTVTNSGSGYTSNPAVSFTVTAGSCNPLPTAYADIYSPVMDGGTGMHGSSTNVPAELSLTAQYATIDHIEFKNWLYYNGSAYSSGSPVMIEVLTTNAELRNIYVHHFAEYGTANAANLAGARDAAQTAALSGTNNTNFLRSVVNNSIFNNYESEAQGCDNGGIATTCVQNTAIFGMGEATNNIINGWRAGVYTQFYGPSYEYLVAGNKVWAILCDAATQHPDSFYLTGPTVSYNNILRDIYAGAAAFYIEDADGNSPAEGATTWMFNNVMYGKGTTGSGTSTPPIGWTAEFVDSGASSVSPASDLRAYNNTFYSYGGNTNCINAGQWYGNAPNLTWNFTLANNHCISSQASGHWYASVDTAHCTAPNGCGTWNGRTDPNSAAAQAVIDPTAVVQSPSAATSSGYTQINNFAPTSASSPTVTFANSSGSTNLTNFCSTSLGGVSLTPLCYDILGNPRPASGGWQAGAYQYTSGSSSQPGPPTGLTAVAQ